MRRGGESAAAPVAPSANNPANAATTFFPNWIMTFLPGLGDSSALGSFFERVPAQCVASDGLFRTQTFQFEHNLTAIAAADGADEFFEAFGAVFECRANRRK